MCISTIPHMYDHIESPTPHLYVTNSAYACYKLHICTTILSHELHVCTSPTPHMYKHIVSRTPYIYVSQSTHGCDYISLRHVHVGDWGVSRETYISEVRDSMCSWLNVFVTQYVRDSIWGTSRENTFGGATELCTHMRTPSEWSVTNCTCVCLVEHSCSWPRSCCAIYMFVSESRHPHMYFSWNASNPQTEEIGFPIMTTAKKSNKLSLESPYKSNTFSWESLKF